MRNLLEDLRRFASASSQRGLRATLHLASREFRSRLTPRQIRHETLSTFYGLLESATKQDPEFVAWREHVAAPTDVKLLAYYLPQFHPIPENDKWWGRGFTEWSSVGAAKPLFAGHYQPRLPADLGYYDLRLTEVMRQQVEIAKNFGLHGFCFYYYWFSGRRLLESPLYNFLRNPDIDFPFCLIWANENWTRTWDGLEGNVLMAQKYTLEDRKAFVDDLIGFVRDPRYIRVGGRPLLVVYKPEIIPTLEEVVETWRARFEELGMAQPFLVAAQTTKRTNPMAAGFDAAVEFVPHTYKNRLAVETPPMLNPEFRGFFYDYGRLVNDSIARPAEPYDLLRCATPGWDNTPRRKNRSTIFLGSTPSLFETWLRELVRQAREALPIDRRFVFVNAWNEWAEGAYLEPDRKYGYAYLEACRRALEPRPD